MVFLCYKVCFNILYIRNILIILQTKSQNVKINFIFIHYSKINTAYMPLCAINKQFLQLL